jgi:hypothetical protein
VVPLETGTSVGSPVREVRERRRALAEVALEPAHRRPLVLRRLLLSVQVNELERDLKFQVRELGLAPGSNLLGATEGGVRRGELPSWSRPLAPVSIAATVRLVRRVVRGPARAPAGQDFATRAMWSRPRRNLEGSCRRSPNSEPEVRQRGRDHETQGRHDSAPATDERYEWINQVTYCADRTVPSTSRTATVAAP